MTRRSKVLGVIGILLALGVSFLAYRFSYEKPCGPSPALPAGAQTMKGVVARCYGSPEVLRFENVVKPIPADDELLVKVHAASANPLDWHYMRGKPYIMRGEAGFGAPADSRTGVDFAGTVEAVGKSVKSFKPGDAVFGGRSGAFAEYLTVRESRAVVLKPENVTFEQAAAVPIAGITALQALRDTGKLKPGQKVLINGASGGVGTFAVQIAKSMGAEVTGVCSGKNVQMVKSIGADHVFDYTREDFMKSGQRYDLILDTVGNRGLMEYRQVLTPHGVFVVIGGSSSNDWLGPLTGALKATVLSPFVSQDFSMMLSDLTKADMNQLRDLMQAGKLTPVIDRHYPLSEAPAAIAYLEEGHARGKVILDVVTTAAP
jgi:NADPH:quinone reductase-like Zn-dependent oxidoreductase